MKWEQFLVLGVCHEQETEQHQQCHLIGVPERFRARLSKPPRVDQRPRQTGNNILVDSFSQPNAQVRRVVGTPLEDLGKRSPSPERVGAHQEPQVSGLVLANQIEIHLDECLGPASAPGTDARFDRIDPDGAAGRDYHVVEVLSIGSSQCPGDRRHAIEKRRGRLDFIGPLEKDRHGDLGPLGD